MIRLLPPLILLAFSPLMAAPQPPKTLDKHAQAQVNKSASIIQAQLQRAQLVTVSSKGLTREAQPIIKELNAAESAKLLHLLQTAKPITSRSGIMAHPGILTTFNLFESEAARKKGKYFAQISYSHDFTLPQHQVLELEKAAKSAIIQLIK